MSRLQNRPVDIESWALEIKKTVYLEATQFAQGNASSLLQRSYPETLQQIKEITYMNQPYYSFPSRYKKYLPFGLNQLVGPLFLRVFNVLFRKQRYLNDLITANLEKCLNSINQLDLELQLTKKELHTLQNKIKTFDKPINTTP